MRDAGRRTNWPESKLSQTYPLCPSASKRTWSCSDNRQPISRTASAAQSSARIIIHPPLRRRLSPSADCRTDALSDVETEIAAKGDHKWQSAWTDDDAVQGTFLDIAPVASAACSQSRIRRRCFLFVARGAFPECVQVDSKHSPLKCPWTVGYLILRCGVPLHPAAPPVSTGAASICQGLDVFFFHNDKRAFSENDTAAATMVCDRRTSPWIHSIRTASTCELPWHILFPPACARQLPSARCCPCGVGVSECWGN